MKTFKFSLAIITLIFISLISCENEKIKNELISDTPIVHIENNTLIFSSWSEYNIYSDYVLKLDESERRAYERSIGFKSLATEIEELYMSMTNKSFDEIERIVNNNNDIIERDNNNQIHSKIFSQSYKTIINRNGKVIVNGSTIIITESSFKEYKNDILVYENKIINEIANPISLKSAGGEWIIPYSKVSGNTSRLLGDGTIVVLEFRMKTVYIPEAACTGCTQYTFCQKVELGATAFNNYGTPVQLQFKSWDTYGNVEAYFISGNGYPVIQNVDFTLPNKIQQNPGFFFYNEVEIGGVGVYNSAPVYTLQFNTVTGKCGAVGFSEYAYINKSR